MLSKWKRVHRPGVISTNREFILPSDRQHLPLSGEHPPECCVLDALALAVARIKKKKKPIQNHLWLQLLPEE